MSISPSEKVLRLARKKKIFRSRDLDDIHIPQIYLKRLVERGELVKLERGIYTLPDVEISEYQSLIEARRKVPNGVVCLLSALSFHQLTTQSPFEVWLAIERTAWMPRAESLALRIVRFSGKAFTEGIETHKLEGEKIRVYSAAKTIADCFKYRNKIGLDVALEALRDGWRKRRTTTDELWHYATICRVANVMRPYLESLT